jgi:hypothetical protein
VPDGLVVTDQWGRPLPTVVPPTPPRPGGRPPPAAATYGHPEGARLYTRDVVSQSADREQDRLGYQWIDGGLVRTRASPGENEDDDEDEEDP